MATAVCAGRAPRRPAVQPLAGRRPGLLRRRLVQLASCGRRARRPRSRPTTFPIRPTRRTCWRSSGRRRTGGSARPPSTNRPTAATASPPRRSSSRAPAPSCWASRSRAPIRASSISSIAAPRAAPDARALGRRGRDLDDVRHRAVDRRAPASHHRRRSGGSGRHLPARDRRGRRAAGGEPRRRRQLRHADHADGRGAERVRAAGERHGAGRRPAARRRRRDDRRVWRGAPATAA